MSGGASDGIATFISPMPLGGMVGRCADSVAVSAANYRSISSLQPSCSLPLSHRYHHLATVRMAVERTCILELATPLALTPSTLACGLPSASPPLGNYSARFSLRHSYKGFRVGHTWVSAPALLAGCRLYFHTACQALPPVWWVVWQAAGCAIVHRKCVSVP